MGRLVTAPSPVPIDETAEDRTEPSRPGVRFLVDEAVFEDVCEALGEIDLPAQGQIRRLLARLGPEAVGDMVDAALLVQKGGGALKRDGNPRTLGGVFFFLMAHHPIGQKVVQPYYKHRIPSDPEPNRPALSWKDRLCFAVEPKGEVAKVKIVVMGRPGQVTQGKGFVAMVLSESKVPSLPKGLPAPPPQPTEYMLFVPSKHWPKVQAALAKDPTDQIVAEGWCALDAEAERIAVFATQTTTRATQRKAREAQTAGEPSEATPSA